MTNTNLPARKLSAPASDVWRLSDMIVKVKEPIEKEYGHFREGLVLFTYLHLALFPRSPQNCWRRKSSALPMKLSATKPAPCRC